MRHDQENTQHPEFNQYKFLTLLCNEQFEALLQHVSLTMFICLSVNAHNERLIYQSLIQQLYIDGFYSYCVNKKSTCYTGFLDELAKQLRCENSTGISRKRN